MKNYTDIEGDGGSFVLEQVLDQQQKIQNRLSSVSRVLAVGSGKGGVGKSTLTFQLATLLNRKGFRVAVLDADFNGPSIARMAGLKDVPPIPGEDGLLVPRSKDGIGVLSLGSFLPEDTALEFPSVAKGESHTWRATKEFSTLADILASTDWMELDFLLLDLPPGADRLQYYAEFFGTSVSFLLVTVPSDVSRGVVLRSVAALEKYDNHVLGYVENMAGYYCHGCDALQPLFPHASEVELPLQCLGTIPFDPVLAQLCDRGEEVPAQGPGPAQEAISRTIDNVIAALETRDEIPLCPM